MLEELFQVLAKKNEVTKVEQSQDKIVVYFSILKSSNINGTSLLSKLYKINRNFSVLYTNKILKVVLDIRNLEKHFMYYLAEMISIIE